jgi:hypothetical protein
MLRDVCAYERIIEFDYMHKRENKEADSGISHWSEEFHI